MVAIFYNNIPFEREFLEWEPHNLAFGRFFTAWSQVESSYCFVARQLTAMEPTIISVLLDKARTAEILEIVFALAEGVEDDTSKARLLSALSEAKELSTKRNKMVHGGWGRLDGEMARFCHDLTMDDITEIAEETQKGKSKRLARIFTVTDIEALTARCVAARDELISLLDELPNIRARHTAEFHNLKARYLELHLELQKAQSPQPRSSEG